MKDHFDIDVMESEHGRGWCVYGRIYLGSPDLVLRFILQSSAPWAEFHFSSSKT